MSFIYPTQLCPFQTHLFDTPTNDKEKGSIEILLQVSLGTKVWPSELYEVFFRPQVVWSFVGLHRRVFAYPSIYWRKISVRI